MASYEAEHNTENPSSQTTSQPQPRRPDLSTFFATLSEITPNPGETRARPHAIPVPTDVSAAFRTLAEAFDIMRREHELGDNGIPSVTGTDYRERETERGGGGLLDQMIEALLQAADLPPKEVEGVSEEFCDSLDRISKTALKPNQFCPICSNPFLDDPYPLVVRLPCHPAHLFDLECVRPWLRLRGTCPLDRVDFGKQLREKELEQWRQAQKRAAGRGAVVNHGSEDEEEWDGLYG